MYPWRRVFSRTVWLLVPALLCVPNTPYCPNARAQGPSPSASSSNQSDPLAEAKYKGLVSEISRLRKGQLVRIGSGQSQLRTLRYLSRNGDSVLLRTTSSRIRKGDHVRSVSDTTSVRLIAINELWARQLGGWNHTYKVAGWGALIGAVIGAVTGYGSNNDSPAAPARRAIIGVAVGALVGGVVGALSPGWELRYRAE